MTKFISWAESSSERHEDTRWKRIRSTSETGLEEAKPVMTSSVKRTPTTESLVKLEGERRAMYRTVVGKLLYMCQERVDVMYSVKETAR